MKRFRAPSAFLLAACLAGGCSSNEHLLREHSEGGVDVRVEGTLGARRLDLFAIRVQPAADVPATEFTDVACRLFEDRDEDGSFAPARDRSIGVFQASGGPISVWHLGPLGGDLRDATPRLETRATTAEGEVCLNVLSLGDGEDSR